MDSDHPPPKSPSNPLGQQMEPNEEDGDLFRKEVLEEQGNKLVGDVILLWTPRLVTLVLFYSAFAMGVSFLLIFGTYQRKERVPGILVPIGGIVAVVADTPGRMAEVLVNEGDEVQKGQALLKINHETFLVSREGKSSLQLNELKHDFNRQTDQLGKLRQLQAQDQKELDAKIETLEQSLPPIQTMIRLKSSQIVEARKSVEAALRLLGQKIIARSEYEQQLEKYSNIKALLTEEERRLVTVQNELRETRLQRDRLDQDYRTRAIQMKSQTSELKQRIVELESQKQHLVQSPVQGLVSGLRTHVGQPVTPSQVLLKLIPKDMNLEAHLFVPARAVPFVTSGQRVWLQFDALSPTKYGVFPGRVVSVSQTSLAAGEVSELKLEGSRYLTRVKIDPKWSARIQEEVNFKAGIQLEADILMQRRSLLTWMLEPLMREREAHGLEEP